METWFYRNPRALALALMLIAAMGGSAFLTIGRQEDPTITSLFATVVTAYPGADPARVEALVTEKIEAELREIPAIAEIASVSRAGLSLVRVELDELTPKDVIETAWTDVRNALDDARPLLPQGAAAPEFNDESGGAYTAIVALAQREGDAADPGLVARAAEHLAERLRQIPGTETVDVFGAASEEILVEADAARLTAIGLGPAEVAAAIAAADAKRAAGRVAGADTDLIVEIEGEIADLARIRRVPLAEGAAGALVRVGDVAEVRRAVADPPDSLALHTGRPAVLVAARMTPDLQVDAWAGRLRASLDGFAAERPAGLEQALIFDQSAYTRARFAELGGNLALGVALVVAVLFVTLGLRAALVVASVLPLAGLMSIWGMNAVGVSIHQMSVTGLIVALGLLVDAAIVMTDEIRRRLATGEPRLEALGRSVRVLAAPLAASTLTTVLAFAPMALLPGPVGDFVGSIALSVIIMLVASFALAMTITPALAGHVLPAEGAPRAPAWWRDGIAAPRLARVFGASIALSLRHPGLAILASLALPFAGFLAFPTLTAQFFPGADRNQFHVQMRLAGTPAIAATEAAARRADAILRGTPGIADIAWVVGESAPAFYYNMTGDQDGVSGYAEALVTTASVQATEAIIPPVQARLAEALPEAEVVVRDLVQGPPVAAPIELRFVGRDLAVLREVGDRARALLAATPGVTLARATIEGGPPQLVVAIDEDRLALAGLDLGAAAAGLAARLDGATGGSLVEGNEEMPVRVRLAEAERASAQALRDIELVAPAASGAEAHPALPLGAVSRLDLAPSDSPIDRRNGERINLVQGFVALGVLPEEALAEVRARLDALPGFLPPGVRLEFGGDADARADTVNNLVATLAMVVVLTLATLTLAFGSFRLTAITLVVGALSMGLALLALAVFRHPFGINALIGVIGSIGVSINAAIIVLSALDADPRARAGDRAAIRDVVVGAGRHIVSTTITTVGGFLPLILAGGGFWPPFATAIAGGVALSTVVSFYFTPPMFALVMRPRHSGKALAAPA